MGSYKIKLLLFCGLLAVAACKKKAGQGIYGVPNPAFDGTWTWVGSGYPGGNAHLITPGSGVRKSLTFLASGILYVTHNDTPGSPAYLNVYDTLGLFPKSVVDTEKFQLGNEPDGCVSDTYPALIITGETQAFYRYTISGDTLQISFSPCLAPFTTYYVKN